MTPAPASSLRCRPIVESDLDAVISLLRRGFTDRSERYWRDGLARHMRRNRPAGYADYGYLLEAAGAAVGVLLTLHRTVTAETGDETVRCNLSSWYVEPGFQSQGALLEKVATRRRDMTSINVTPAPATWPILEARGFQRYCHGQMLALPVLNRPRAGATVRLVRAEDPLEDLSPADRTLMRDHLAYGCVGLVGTDRTGPRPLVFQRRTIGLIPNEKRFGQVPCMQLVYCRASADVARFAAGIGRRLLRCAGTPLVVVDAEGSIPGLVGRFFPGRAVKYRRGPDPVELGDLAYTELVIFGP